MKHALIFILSHMPVLLFSNWELLLEQYHHAMSENTYQVLMKQYQDFNAGKAPIIADPRIKEISIQECNEELVDVKTVRHPRITVMDGQELVEAHASVEDIDPRSPQHSKMRKGVFECLTRMITELDRLAPLFGYEPGDLEIRLFEGLRDIATQKQLFDTTLESIMKNNPTMTHEEAYRETSQWVSPYINNVPVHTTGAAIDIHLWNKKTHTFCDMGRFNRDTVAPTFTNYNLLTPQQCKNRLLFTIAATQAGLTNYVYEFWHFSYGDRYASYWRESHPALRSAIYGSV